MVRRILGITLCVASLSACGLVVGLRGDYVLGDGGLDASGEDAADGGGAVDTGAPDSGADSGMPADSGFDGPAWCVDKVQNNGESDVDCGGMTPCPRCVSGKSCTDGGDCVNGVCNMGGKCK